ncbi:TRAP transporter small permease subunit [Salinisphaera aquimarina]|uniref:TRAP transporter small permease protein n=1 Tax=Salinisphaera aquimarina TaxID=2094031 RepID=A0ABV7EPV2_9GAMM
MAVLDLPGIWVGKAAAWLILPMTGALVFEVISRYAFGRPTSWAYDMTFMFYGSIFMLAAAYTLGRDQHVRADFLYNILPVRWQGASDAFFYFFFFFPAIGIFTWLTYQYAWRSWSIGESLVSSPWQPIIYPFKMVMPVTGALLLIQGLSETIKCLYCVVTNKRFTAESE